MTSFNLSDRKMNEKSSQAKESLIKPDFKDTEDGNCLA